MVKEIKTLFLFWEDINYKMMMIITSLVKKKKLKIVRLKVRIQKAQLPVQYIINFIGNQIIAVTLYVNESLTNLMSEIVNRWCM